MSFEKRVAVIREARSWIGTPYVHHSAIKGVGVDCAMLLVAVFQRCGLVDENFDPRPYPPDWFLHRDEERFVAYLEQWARRIPEADVRPGDVALYRFGRTAAHGAIVIDAEMMIHANRAHGNVELIERRAIADRLDSYWSVFA